MKGPQYLNYPGNVEHIVGDKFISPYFRADKSADIVGWVATDAVYDEATNFTRVEFDVIGEPQHVV